MNFVWYFLWGVRNGLIPSHHNDYRPHLVRRSMLLALLALILGAEGFFVAGLATNSEQSAAVVQSDLVTLTNEERALNNNSILTENGLLDLAALAKAKDMAAKGYFAHTGPDGKLPWAWLAEVGYRYQLAGENLAVRFTESNDVVEGWMNSPTHRANILKPEYTEIGIATAEGEYQGEPATYVVQYFAAPAKIVVPQVAAAAAIPHAGVTNQTLDKILRALSDPATTNWVLGGTGLMLIVALFLTFFVHIQVQHGRVLMGTAAVALFALTLLAANNQYVGSASTQSASVVHSLNLGGVVDEQGSWITLEQ
ncbi:CAP domain-containing protein [Candidatus Parcubacteria bacterium]|nr:CAP domain-containing protein [Candidatus Parcubacteria bacterium]